ncbi:Radical SAM domain protein [Ignisphaera aggregans DSM 17230]|uniref:Radical SAM domain protein n=1 Tax=Ignisphaera aggregans (strain DSM 17230 / JCM 13409 / AQ1.S1) TaxID=583356 RepID=E0SSM6_IGNAA|nr:Radical SAM domain protein [Ignisphaera aggregans DSM 17230]
MPERGGTSSFLAVIRILFNNSITRAFLYRLTRIERCIYRGKIYERSVIYHALSIYSGEDVSCPIMTRFSIEIINNIIKMSIKLLKGDENELKETLKDPALRRGVETVLKGIALYGVTIPQALPAPFLIVWNFTNMCNLRCLHCYQRADRPLPDELSLSEKLSLVDELDKIGVAAVALSGGEPTIHPDYFTIVKALSSRGIYVATATNGWRFADLDELKKAVEAGLRYIEVSIDSAKPSKHDWFRGVDGSWKRAVKALENAVKIGLSHAMAVTITKYNLDEVDDILDLAEEIGVKRVVFFNFIPVGRGTDIVDSDLSPIEREEFLRKIYMEMKRRKIEIYSTAPQYGRIVLQLSGGSEAAPSHFAVRGDPITRAIAEFIGGCGAGRIYAAIQPNGVVSPCVFLPIDVGSIRHSSFRELWETNPILKKLRNKNLLEANCGRCQYRFVCGGCRARAYTYTGNIMGPDPGCIYNSSVWNNIIVPVRRVIH